MFKVFSCTISYSFISVTTMQIKNFSLIESCKTCCTQPDKT